MWYDDKNLIEDINFKVSLKIDLEAGIYAFESESCIGKTRLYSLIKSREIYTNEISALTFNDIHNNEDIIRKLLDKEECKTVFLDRYDLYNYIDYLHEYKTTKVILIDCKGYTGQKTVVSMCKIYNLKDEIFIGDIYADYI